MWEQIRYNQTKTAMLILEMGGLLLLMGLALGLIVCLAVNLMDLVSANPEPNYPTPPPVEFGLIGVIIAAVVLLFASLVGYYQGDDILVALSKAKKIDRLDHRRLYNIVEELKISSGLEEAPAIYIIDNPALNAFAIGRDPKKAAIIVTSGLLAKLNRDELQGVIGHEIAHIKNRDVLLMVMCSILAGATIMLANLPSLLSWSETTITPRNDALKKYSDRSGMIVIFLTIWVCWVIAILIPTKTGPVNLLTMAVLTLYITVVFTPVTMAIVVGLPFVVLLIYYATSRRREYLADASSALYTRYPEGLASALEKIAASTDQLLSANPATAPLYIANPFGKNSTTTNNLTSTHPPISERIRILRSMTHVSYADYDRAYQKVSGTAKSVLPDYAIAAAGTATIRPPQPDDLDHIQRARETSNVLWNVNNYKIINCPCGTRMRLPPKFKYPEVKCPHCGKMNPV